MKIKVDERANDANKAFADDVLSKMTASKIKLLGCVAFQDLEELYISIKGEIDSLKNESPSTI